MPATPSSAATATARWRAELLGATGRDALLHYEDSPTGTLDLATAHPSGLAQFLAGRPTRLSDLFRESGALAAARRRARGIRLAAAQLADQHGIGGSYLASGMATWQPPGADRPVVAPVLLRPLTLRPVGGGQVDDDLDLGRHVTLNPSLVRALSREGVDVDAREVAALALAEYGFSPRPALAALAGVAGHLNGFRLTERTVLGVFVDVVPALLADLDRLARELDSHPLVAALAAHEAAVAAPKATEPHRVHEPKASPVAHAVPGPFDVPFALTELDVDQRRVLGAVALGRSVRVSAPPGSGATRLLAQLVASGAGTGRRTLLVAGQAAELAAVLDSLTTVGLGHVVHDPGGLLDGVRGRRPRSTDRRPSERPASPDDGQDDARVSAREALTALATRRDGLHRPLDPWGVSVLQALHALTRLTAGSSAPMTKVRLDRASAARLVGGRREAAEAQLRKLAELGAFDSRSETSAWHRASFASAQAAREAVDTARRVARQGLPILREHMTAIAAGTGLAGATSVVDCGRQIDLLVAVRATLETFVPMVYERSVSEMIAATATPQWRDDQGIRMSAMERRRWRRQARELLRPGAQPRDLHDALVRAQAERGQWQHLSAGGGWPRVPSGLAQADDAYQRVLADLRRLEEPLATTADGAALATAPLDALSTRLARLAVEDDVSATLPDRVAASIPLREDGLGGLLTDLGARRVSADRVGDELQLCWWASVLQLALTDRPVYGSDAEAVSAFVAARDAQWKQAALSLQATPDTARGSCTVVSPLALPQLLGPDERFDVVVVADAHLCGVPEGALAVARGRQVLVVGDPKGLAPTRLDIDSPTASGPAASGPTASGPTASGPAASGAEASTGGGVPARPSLLHAAVQALPTLELTHQHRMPEQLARLAGVPSAWDVPVPDSPLRLEVVPGGASSVDPTGSGESVDAEVRRVVKLVFAHARSGRDQSVAVVAVTRNHARRIADAIRSELSDNRALARYFTRRGAEPFVVTDLSRCGDAVRDVVLLSVGYGQAPNGRVVHEFGPLDEDGGDRALAVAVTRARQSLTVVSSLTAAELDPAKLRTPGSRLLRQLLQTAADGPDVWAEGTVTALDPLLDDLRRRLVQLGLQVRAGVGHAGWPDLLVKATDGSPVAVLTDARWDAAAAAGGSPELVLDDLSVAEHLERFGWHVVRLSSLELFTDPRAAVGQIRRLSATVTSAS